MKKIKYIVLIMFSIFFIGNVNANHIYGIDINIDLDQKGTGTITEVWDVKGSDGTEWYQSIYDLGNMELTDFTVSMDGKPLEKKNWNVKESLSQKAGYYGINYVDEGRELCFGKTDYKRHTFTVQFKLSNMIFNTEDAQVLYYNALGNFSNVEFENFSLNVNSFYEFPDTLDVWGYGYKGYAYVKDGKISMSNEGDLGNDYVVLLAKFPQNTFDTTNTYPEYKIFNDVLESAEEGSFEYDYSNYDNYEEGIEIPLIVLAIIIAGPLLIFLIIPYIIGKIYSFLDNKIPDKSYQYGYLNNKKIKEKNVNFYRDIPCNGNIYIANALIYMNNFGYEDTNIFGAIILKWVIENKISYDTSQKTIKFLVEPNKNPNLLPKDYLELQLYKALYRASKDGNLKKRELKKWNKDNPKYMLNIFADLRDETIKGLYRQGEIKTRNKINECFKSNIMSENIYVESEKLLGLKKFFKEFSRIDDKQIIEVKLWKEYLMFAYLFGMADKVYKNISKFYPEIKIDFDYEIFDYLDNEMINLVSDIIKNNIQDVTSQLAKTAFEAALDYSGGGGGFSSGGGGGGSFGGGGGGSR